MENPADKVRPSDIVRRLKDLNPDAGDTTYGLVKGGISAIPFAGGILAELFGTIVVPPLAKRQHEFIELLAESLVEINDKVEGFDINTLSDNPAFVSAVAIASPIALRTHQRAKLKALRNAVLNVALGAQPNENKQQMFLTLIDELTEDHLIMLHYLSDPFAYLRQMGLVEHVEVPNERPGSPSRRMRGEGGMERLVRAFPELKGQEPYVNMIVATLYGRGLVIGDWPRAADIQEIADTTLPAKEFLAFIKSPLEPDAV